MQLDISAISGEFVYKYTQKALRQQVRCPSFFAYKQMLLKLNREC